MTHFDRTFAGANNLRAYSLGGYWTHFGATGWYLDAILQGTWYDVRSASTSFPALTTNGWGFASSLEAGYPIKLGGGFIIEPQAQVVYQTVSLGDSGDTAATVQFRNANSVAARIGARVARTWSMDDSTQLQADHRLGQAQLLDRIQRQSANAVFIRGGTRSLPVGSRRRLVRVQCRGGCQGYGCHIAVRQWRLPGQHRRQRMTAYNGKGGLRVAW